MAYSKLKSSSVRSLLCKVFHNQRHSLGGLSKSSVAKGLSDVENGVGLAVNRGPVGQVVELVGITQHGVTGLGEVGPVAGENIREIVVVPAEGVVVGVGVQRVHEVPVTVMLIWVINLGKTKGEGEMHT